MGCVVGCVVGCVEGCAVGLPCTLCPLLPQEEGFSAQLQMWDEPEVEAGPGARWVGGNRQAWVLGSEARVRKTEGVSGLNAEGPHG